MLGLVIIPIFFILSGVRAIIDPNLVYDTFCSGLKASAADVAQTQMIFYTGPTINDDISRLIGDSKSLSQFMNINNPIYIYTHGWGGNCSIPQSLSIISGFIGLGNVNMVCVDWWYTAKESYPKAACTIESVAIAVSDVMNYWSDNGFKNFHVIGHSLGGQMCGFIGRHVKFPIGKITGLDPAGPIFDEGSIPHLTSTDAICVEVYHTNAGEYGSLQEMGTRDFFFNGGTIQPGCPLEVLNCSHWRSAEYAAESLGSGPKFIACPCTLDHSAPATCDSSSMVDVGLDASCDVTGNYCLNTNSQAPFSKGVDGASQPAPVSLLGAAVSIIGSVISLG